VALQAMGLVHGMKGDFGRARELLAEARRTLTELGMVIATAAGVSAMWGVVEALAEDWEAAEREWQSGYDRLEQLGETGYLSTVAGYLAHSFCAQERYAEAEEMARIARSTGAADDVITQMLWRGARAKVVAHAGNFAEAERLAREAVELGARTDFLDSYADALLDLVEVLRLAGMSAEMEPLIEEALVVYERKQHLVGVERARRLLTELAA
jgi:tetratricopeptide (TPR) repeat protein